MAKKKHNHDVDEAENPKSMKHTVTKEEHHDWALDASTAFIRFIETHRKSILYGILGIIVAIIGFSVIVYFNNASNEKISDKFYVSSTDFLEKARDMEIGKLKGLKPTEDEISKIAAGYKMILSETTSRPEAYLSQFNLGMIFYSIQDYKNASDNFHAVYKNRSDFPLAFQALQNIGHSYFSWGYQLQQQGKYADAIKKYQSAFEIAYSRMDKVFPTAPSVPLSYRYAGLSLEYAASCHLKLNAPDKAKLALQNSRLQYQKLKEFATNNEKELSSNMIRSPLEEAELGLRRVENSLSKLK
ncbi:MAG: hypothetical protein OEZ36_07345 [Spirochaetota bacterium]|nr:hypothetical protein [Spirochaetota bacterium]